MTAVLPGGFLDLIGVDLPIIQAPMAGVSSPAMAAAVSDAGALGSIALGAASVETAATMINQVRNGTDRPFNVNLFCHEPARRNRSQERAWIERLAPSFAEYGEDAPDGLTVIYESFVSSEAMQRLVLELKPPVASFHFGVPPDPVARAMKAQGMTLLVTVTSREEAAVAERAGADVLVAQGWEAGGHRGTFDPEARDEQFSTLCLTQLLLRCTRLPVVAAGGIMDGAGIAAALTLGASAAQLGTAFVATDESLADPTYKASLAGPPAWHTTMTRVVSGRPARSLVNRITELGREARHDEIPPYPIAYDLAKALHAAARRRNEYGFGAQWAGQGAPLARALPARDLVRRLADELNLARRGAHA